MDLILILKYLFLACVFLMLMFLLYQDFILNKNEK